MRENQVFVFGWMLLTVLWGGLSHGQTSESDTQYQILPHNGAPALFIKGKPVFYSTWWCSAPEKDQWVRADFARKNAAETGIHIYAFDVGRQEWVGPGKGHSGHFDFSSVKERYERILEVDPDALFHLRILSGAQKAE